MRMRCGIDLLQLESESVRVALDDSWALLDIRDLEIRFGSVEAVRGISLQIDEGEVLGWSRVRSGKSATALAILGLLGPAAQVTGQILWQGTDCCGNGECSAAAARARDCHDLSGADDGAESGNVDWPPGGRRLCRAHCLLDRSRAERKAIAAWRQSIFPMRHGATATIRISFPVGSGSAFSLPWRSSTGHGC